MEYRQLGDSDLRVSEICLGTWTTFGGSLDEDAAVALVDSAFDVGVNFFDTANIYSEGRSEEVLGRALAGRPRDSFVVATKLLGEMPNGDRGLSREQVLKQIDDSLGRLQLDHVDLYQCHAWDDDVPVEETLGALTEVVEAGKARFVGVSNWSGEQIRGAVDLAREQGFAKIVSSQPEYSLLHRDAEEDVIPASRENGVSQIVYSPLAQGVLSGKYRARGVVRRRHARRRPRRRVHVAVPRGRRARAGAAPRADRGRSRHLHGPAGARLDPPRAERRERDRRRVAAGAAARQCGRLGRRARRRDGEHDRRRVTIGVIGQGGGMKTIATVLVLLVAAGAQAAGASLGRTDPSLRVVKHSPVVVRGAHFHPAERVTVRAPALHAVRVVHTTATGTFRARLGRLPTDRCSFAIVAVGARGDRAQAKVSAMCPYGSP